jgi:hypothetical protein
MRGKHGRARQPTRRPEAGLSLSFAPDGALEHGKSTRGVRIPRRSNKRNRTRCSRARSSLGDGISPHRRCSPRRRLPMRSLRYLRKAPADPRIYDKRTLANALPHPRLGRIDEQSLGDKRFRLPNVDWTSMTASAHRITVAPLGRSRRLSKPLPVFPVSHRPACDKCYGRGGGAGHRLQERSAAEESGRHRYRRRRRAARSA